MAATTTRRFDLEINQGATWSCTVPVYAEDGITPLALVGYTAVAQVHEPYDDSAVLHSWTVAGGTMTLSLGQITLDVPAATSAAWTWTFGRWFLKLTAPNGAVTRLLDGAVLVDAEAS